MISSNKLLFEERLWPITWQVGLLEAKLEDCIAEYCAWIIQAKATCKLTVNLYSQKVSGKLDDILRLLSPSVISPNKHLFVPTTSNWTGYFNNTHRGTDASSVIHVMCEKLKCRGLLVSATPHTFNKRTRRGRYGMIELTVCGPGMVKFNNMVRTIGICFDTKWVFDNVGIPYQFEDTERYKNTRIEDRFTFDLLTTYLRTFDAYPFDQAFYLPNNATLVQIEQISPPPNSNDLKTWTLEQERDYI